MADFDFKNFRKCKFQNIKEYVGNVHPEYKQTIIDQVNSGYKFIRIKRDFYDKFFPEYIPKAKKEPTITMKKAIENW